MAVLLSVWSADALAQESGSGAFSVATSNPGVVREIFVDPLGSTYVCCAAQACRFACRASPLQGSLEANQCYRIGQDCVPELDDGAIVVEQMDLVFSLIGSQILQGPATGTPTTTQTQFFQKSEPNQQQITPPPMPSSP